MLRFKNHHLPYYLSVMSWVACLFSLVTQFHILALQKYSLVEMPNLSILPDKRYTKYP